MAPGSAESIMMRGSPVCGLEHHRDHAVRFAKHVFSPAAATKSLVCILTVEPAQEALVLSSEPG
jgi:hypothetical protein